MTDEEKKRATAYAQGFFDKLSELINAESTPWMSITDPDQQMNEKQIWSKALLGALAQQLGIIEATLILVDGLDKDDVQAVREMQIRAGHRVCMDTIEAVKAEQEEN